MAAGELSWRDQLTKVRDHVVEQEKRREIEKRLEQERNEEALGRRLKQDTPEALAARFGDIRRAFDRDARKFYPLPQLEEALQSLTDFGDLIRFYDDCIKQFPKVFTPAHKTGIPAILREMTELQQGLDRQLAQWREVKTALEQVQFRARKPSDDAPLVAVAKSFSDRAHKVGLSLPNDYFSRENTNFWVAELGGKPIGYVKYMAADQALNFAIEPSAGGQASEKVNFNKFIRAILWKFCSQGPLPTPLPQARVRVAFVREVKFFTDMGFVRAEVMGPSDWIYQREIA
jgi:hypothetical protein